LQAEIGTAQDLRGLGESAAAASRADSLPLARILRNERMMRARLNVDGRGDDASPVELPPRHRAAALRYILGAVLGFAALNAFAGGYYGLTGAKGIPKEWLRGSPFPVELRLRGT
jgi:hypothetical protein